MTFLYMLWIGLIWLFGWFGWKLLRSGNILGVIFGLIMILIAVGLSAFLFVVMFVQNL